MKDSFWFSPANVAQQIMLYPGDELAGMVRGNISCVVSVNVWFVSGEGRIDIVFCGKEYRCGYDELPKALRDIIEHDPNWHEHEDIDILYEPYLRLSFYDENGDEMEWYSYCLEPEEEEIFMNGTEEAAKNFMAKHMDYVLEDMKEAC